MINPDQQEQIWNEAIARGETIAKLGEQIIKSTKRGACNGSVCDYCQGSGYDPFHNHDTTMRPCPKCSSILKGEEQV